MTGEAERAELGGIDDARRRLSIIRATPHYFALASMIGEQVANGRTLRALRMLRAMGAPDRYAHEIIEGWQSDRVHTLSLQLTGGALDGLAVTVPEVHALRLSFFVEGFGIGSHPWSGVLRRVLENDRAQHPEDYAAAEAGAVGALELLRRRHAAGHRRSE